MERNNEQLSALMDGELDRRESRFLLRRLIADEGLQRDWARYHLARDCMKSEFRGPVDLVARVRGAIAEERMDPVARLSPLARFGIGGAMAAGVAMLAVVGLNQRLANEQIPGEPAPAFVSQSSALDRQFSRQAIPVGLNNLPAGPSRRAADDPRDRISRYIIRHGQASGASNFVSFTPILTSDPAAAAVPLDTGPTDNDAGDAGE
ncbi:sigma-E factor negative regulatory protein [Wenzhouxiangella sp. XN79A]|uniref:sigma-E factor negative regulatory protein n=1 Tax=Wenzhouxiangella sp. XN79A TaxID=2724193 RepID=UPI00144A609D|nr:sigma-E factor negative regulatory protein [Wenzhouxiangella sp. XN79A]NKI34398.1 sigma-E factor negative regulatory protein [Wenzhouxiangella sp. XN79A]